MWKKRAYRGAARNQFSGKGKLQIPIIPKFRESPGSDIMQLCNVFRKRRRGCDKKAVRKDWIERVVVRLTMQRVMDEEKINRLVDVILAMQEQEDTTTPALRSQLAEAESAISNLLKAIEQGIFTPSTKQRLEEIESALGSDLRCGSPPKKYDGFDTRPSYFFI